MEFWGTELKPNQTLKCEPGEDKLLHLSMVTLGETKKASEDVVVYVTFNGKKLVLAHLSAEKNPQSTLDLFFEKEFELSHNSKIATLYIVGYKSVTDYGGDEILSDPDSEEVAETKDDPKANGAIKEKPKVEVDDKAKKAKAGKQNKPLIAPAPADSDEDEDSDSDDDEIMGEADDSSDEEDDSSEEEEADDDDDSSEEEETPKPAGKKRPAEAAKKAPESEKKAKLTTPSDGKKGGEAKKGAATPAKSDKGKPQTPKSAGSVSCKSCTKTFNSEGALDSHTKAKHAAK